MIIKELIPELITWWARLLGWVGIFHRRLGRHIRFDERSRHYRVVLDNTPTDLRNMLWDRQLPPLNQGHLGSCTGNAVVGLLATRPNDRDHPLDDESCAFEDIDSAQDLAIDLYSRATEIDQYQGHYPPTDTGSSVLSAMKAARQAGLIREYRWCFDLNDVLRTLSHVGPVAIGIHWYSGFDSPDSSGLIKVRGRVRGGHAVELLGIDVEKKVVFGVNSWGSRWGNRGRFCMSYADLGRLLKERGEAVVAVR